MGNETGEVDPLALVINETVCHNISASVSVSNAHIAGKSKVKKEIMKMVYLVNGLPENVAVKRWVSKSQVTKKINRHMFDSDVISLLDVEGAEHYSELLNINIPAKDPLLFSGVELYSDETDELQGRLLFGDECFCLLTPKVYSKNSVPADRADMFVRDPGFFVYSGYYDQPLLDFLTYDYQDQVEIENLLVRDDKLEHLPWKKDTGKSAIDAVTKSLKRLLKSGVIEIDVGNEEYLSFVANKNLRETYYRSRYQFRLTGQPETGLLFRR